MPDAQTRQEQAERMHKEGVDLSAAGDEAGALAKYLAALELDLNRPTTLYNVGLIYKYQSAWRESFRFNKRAHELAPDDEATAWNLAIAATALRDWTTARAIWSSLGMKITPGDAPPEEDFGLTPVRLNPEGNAEVVWARRVDPVRARLVNIPFADSGFRYEDLVLHDGAPVGYRTRNGRECPVFNVLELFQASSINTYEADIIAPSQADVDALEAICDQTGITIEDWSQSTRILCKACSEGRPHESHDSDRKDKASKEERTIALAASSDSQVESALDAWVDANRRVTAWRRTLAATSK